MARTTGGGRRLAVFAVAISTLAGIAAFLYAYPPEDLTAALWILTACSLALAGGVALQARVLAGQAVQLSSDLDVVSERLLRLEAEPRSPATTAPDPRLDDLSADVQEATAEIALLGEIVREPRGRRRSPRPRTCRAEGGRRKAGPGAARGAKARAARGGARPRTGFVRDA